MNIKNSKHRKILLPLGLVILTVVLVSVIKGNPPESKRGKPSKASQMTVETQTLQPQAYQVMVKSFGTVAPRTQTQLSAQVQGKITYVSEKFRAGGFFKSGDVLVELDNRDYLAEVNIAKASYVSATQSLAEEKARVKQAVADWKRLGNGSSASDLVLRKPQLEAAQAKMLSSQAQLDKAKLALERTKIIAPYSGRILKKNVDIGQVVSGNTVLASIYATDVVEVRLPISNKDLALVDLPEEFQNATTDIAPTAPLKSDVKLTSDLNGNQSWNASLVRTEGAIDTESQQLYVIAQIANPYLRNVSGNGQVKIGQYVTAEITGRVVENALVIPSSAIYQGSYVYIVDSENLLKRVTISLGWQNGLEATVTEGLSAGDELVLTSLGQVNSGTPVSIEGRSPSYGSKGERHKREKREKPRKEMTPERREKLERIAQEKGISVKQLMAERKAKRQNREGDNL